MFFKKKWLYRPVWDCNALSGLTYTGNVCILAYFIFSKKKKCLMPLKFCNQKKSFEKSKGRVFLKFLT